MMKQVILAVLVLPSAVIAAGLDASSTGLCARIGVQSPAGPAPSRRSSPPDTPAMLRRDVRFQLCTPEGLPLNRQTTLELVIEPLTASFTQGIIGQSVTTDSQGRFYVSYGGNALPNQPPTQELHTFLLDGKVVATFLLERGPEGLLFSRAPEEMARCARPALSEPSR
jgi:hypothetical protein